MKYIEASKLLSLNYNRIRDLVKQKKIKILNADSKKLDPESVYLYKKELDERRSLEKPDWLGFGGNST